VRTRSLIVRAGVAVLCAATLPAVAAGHPAATTTAYSATIRWTEHGIPHVLAKDFKGLGYGYGYALASQNICVLADTYVTVDAQRSRYFGADGSYVFQGNGTTVNNLNSDFFFQQINDERRVEKLVAQPAPQGPRQEVRDLVSGYVAGYNRWLRDVGGAAGISDPGCRGAAWVHPISETEAYRRFYQLALLASSGVAIDGIGSAQPPTPAAPLPATTVPSIAAEQLQERLKTLAIGSNAVAIGSDGTQNGRGLLLGNPHFPWQGSERFFQAQMTIPGTIDVTGGSLLGVPLILIGHTATMAWSHTVSTAFRFTPYQLTLVPGSPTTYLYDGKPEQMTARTVTVQVRQPGGSLQPQSRTLYRSRWGSIMTSILGLPIFPWTPATAFAMADANEANFRYVNHFLETDMATSVQEELAVLQRNQGVPWVNTIVADSTGAAMYADISVVPHVTDADAQRCDTALGAATFKVLGLPVLDGSRADCRWGSDPDSLQPGTFGGREQPVLIRHDYVTNSNDSYWLSNPHQPLTGFPRIQGDEGTARSTRTRLGLTMVEQRLAGTDGMPGRGFTRQLMQDMVFNDRQYAGELTRDDLVAMCRSFPGGIAPSSSGPVDVSAACDVLASWDVRDDLASRGAILFRRFWERAKGASPSPWKVPFDVQDPVNTPRGLDTSNPQVRLALGDAVNDLRSAGIPLDAPLGDWQYATRLGVRIPIHGGPGTDGVFNAINVAWDASKGYVEPPHGSSFVQVVSFDGTACPDAATILTYSQSTDPTSPYYADQTRMYSQRQWVPDRFCASAIAASPDLRVQSISE
jgi:acyl-homoserine-lactone acylase